MSELLTKQPKPDLLFTSRDAADTANDLISYHLSFDMKSTVRWAVPVEGGTRDKDGKLLVADGTWLLVDPYMQCDSDEKYAEVMTRVMDYENAVVALKVEVGV